jgi:hypothetical protein
MVENYGLFRSDRKDSVMTKEKLIDKIRRLLKTDNDLQFLVELRKEELEELIACIRYRLESQKG